MDLLALVHLDPVPLLAGRQWYVCFTVCASPFHHSLVVVLLFVVDIVIYFVCYDSVATDFVYEYDSLYFC